MNWTDYEEQKGHQNKYGKIVKNTDSGITTGQARSRIASTKGAVYNGMSRVIVSMKGAVNSGMSKVIVSMKGAVNSGMSKVTVSMKGAVSSIQIQVGKIVTWHTMYSVLKTDGDNLSN